MHHLKVNVIGNISSIIPFSLRQIFNPFILHFLENCWNFSEISVKLLSRDLGHVTQEMNKLEIVLHNSNPEIISFQMIYEFFMLSIYFYLKFYSKYQNVTFNFGKCPNRGTAKG